MLQELIKVKKLKQSAIIPTYATDYAAGADLYACMEESIEIAPHETKLIPTGLSMELPDGYAALVFARSGLSLKQDLAPANKVGVIDSDYRGEYMVSLHNHGLETRTVSPNDRIAQLVIVPYVTAVFEEQTELSETNRGTGGFGSSGK